MYGRLYESWRRSSGRWDGVDSRGRWFFSERETWGKYWPPVEKDGELAACALNMFKWEEAGCARLLDFWAEDKFRLACEYFALSRGLQNI